MYAQEQKAWNISQRPKLGMRGGMRQQEIHDSYLSFRFHGRSVSNYSLTFISFYLGMWPHVYARVLGP